MYVRWLLTFLMVVATLQSVMTQLLANVISPIDSNESNKRADEALATYLNGKREDDVIMYARRGVFRSQ